MLVLQTPVFASFVVVGHQCESGSDKTIAGTVRLAVLRRRTDRVSILSVIRWSQYVPPFTHKIYAYEYNRTQSNPIEILFIKQGLIFNMLHVSAIMAHHHSLYSFT